MNSFKLLPEWEKHYGTLLTWPQVSSIWGEDFIEIQETWAKITSLLSKHEKVFILIDPKTSKTFLENINELLIKYSCNLNNINFLEIPTNDVWIRDYGPIWVKSSNKKPIGISFGFDGWGKKYFPYDNDNKAGTKILEKLGHDIHIENIILEGGSIETNGEILIVTDSCNLFREPYLEKNEYELIFKDLFGVKKILWIKGALPGDGTDGHIDMLTRFASKNTIITSIANPDSAPYLILKKNIKRIEDFLNLESNTVGGKVGFRKYEEDLNKDLNYLNKDTQLIDNFRYVYLPLPQQTYINGFALARSYANFYIANEQVLVPVYNEKSDEVALKIIESCFPDRTIQAIDCSKLILQGGALHCITMQIPNYLFLGRLVPPSPLRTPGQADVAKSTSL